MAPLLRNLSAVTTALRDGAVLLLPTDTLPGLHGRADLPGVTARIAQIKRRSADKPFVLLAGSLDQVRALVDRWPGAAADYAARCWPGPHTLVLPARGDLPYRCVSDATVAVRVPAVPLLRAAILAVGHPLVSTSANRSGEPPQTDLAAAARAFALEVDGWWNPAAAAWGATGDPADAASDAGAAPSSLIDLSAWPPRLLRAGGTQPPPW